MSSSFEGKQVTSVVQLVTAEGNYVPEGTVFTIQESKKSGHIFTLVVTDETSPYNGETAHGCSMNHFSLSDGESIKGNGLNELPRSHQTAIVVLVSKEPNPNYHERVTRLINSVNRNETIKADIYSLDDTGTFHYGLHWKGDTTPQTPAEPPQSGHVQILLVRPGNGEP